MKKRRILILFAAVVLSAGFFLYHRLRSVRAPEFVLSYAENQTQLFIETPYRNNIRQHLGQKSLPSWWRGRAAEE